MATNLETMVDNVAALAIPGVARDYGTDRPDTLTDDLPAKWLRLARLHTRRMTFDVVNAFGGGFPILGLIVEVVVAIEAVGQNLNDANFQASVDMADAMNKVLSQADIADSWPGQGDALQIYVDMVSVGAQWFWAVVAPVRVTG